MNGRKRREKNIDLSEAEVSPQEWYYLKLLEEKRMKTGIGICQCKAGNTVGETKIAQPALL
jgi:hypothetical protein